MARILLGVSGGIAAYKAVELVRLATRRGHSVRVVQTPAEPELRRRGHVRGHHRGAGAGRRVRARSRRVAPSRATPCPTTTRSPTWSWCAALRRVRDRARLGQHDRQAGRRPRRQPAHQRRAGLHRAAGDRAGDEQPHVGAPGHARQRGDAAPARGHDRRARHRPAGLEGRVGGGPPGRAGRRSSRAVEARAGRRLPVARRACACWSPRAAPASRSTPCATSATAPRAGWAWRWPPRPRAAAPT